MPSLNQYLYQIYEQLNINSDDSTFDSRFLIDKINSKRQFYYEREFAKTGKTIEATAIQDLGCVDFIEVSSEECCGEDSNCSFIRSKNKIPTPLQIRDKVAITRVGPTSKSYRAFDIIDYRRAPFVGTGKYNRKEVFAFYLNQYIYIVSNDDSILLFEKLNISGVFSDPTKVSDFKDCDGTVCFSMEQEYPLSQKYWDYILPLILKELESKLILSEDNENDGNTERQGET